MTLSLLLAMIWPPDELQVIAALQVRHDPPACSTLDAMLADPVPAWAHIAEQAHSPPWVGIRAAICLMDHGDAAGSVARRWVTDPGLAGLADVALQRLDRLTEPVALDLARAALSGPHRELAVRRLALAARPSLRALPTGSP